METSKNPADQVLPAPGGEWVWEALAQDEDRMPVWAEVDHDFETEIDSSRFRYDPNADPKIFPPPSKWSGEAVFRVKYCRLKKVSALSCIPTTSASPLVDETLREVICEFVPQSEVFFYPATVQTSDGATRAYSIVIPLVAKECIDIARCEGVGRMPDITPDFVWGYRTAKHFNNCIGDKHMIRDLVYPGHIVISNELKSALQATGDAGLAFHKIEEITNVGYFDE